MKTSGRLEAVSGAAGVDEVGRGALAGPLVVAAVILPDDFDVEGLDDSKKLSEAQRKTQNARILKDACCSVVFIEPEEIDRINILQATLAGMTRAVAGLGVLPRIALVDGNQLPALNCPGQTVIKGDGTYAAIAAASIIAKVARDEFMRSAAKDFPGYGFEGNVGYGAKEHLDGLASIGPCVLHRRSFEPVKSMVNQPCLDL